MSLPNSSLGKHAVASLSLVAALVAPRSVDACAACGGGDPTLTSTGTEQPFAGRLRGSLELRYRTDATGEPGLNEIELEEFRLDSSLAWAPHERLFLLAVVPVLFRRVTDANLATTSTTGPGDAELRAKYFLYKDRDLAPRVLVASTVGLRLPTGPWYESTNGDRLPLETQPGTGSWDALLGASLAIFGRPWSGYGSAQLSLPFATRAPLEPGRSLRATLAGQHQTLPWLALRAALDVRLDSVTYEDDQPDPNSGGFVLFAGGDVLFSPFTDWTFSLSIRIPTWNELNGNHHEGAVASTAVMVDW